LGYLNTGSGKAKAVDPERAPFVRDAFELYASGRFSVESLVIELHRRGLRHGRGGMVHRSSLSRILNNPFYAGLLRLRRSGEVFPGAHTALVSLALFKQVQARLAGRYRSTGWRHDFTLRGLFQCSLCSHPLVGERQKGHVYYRCHTASCPTKGFREETLETAMLSTWPDLCITPEDKEALKAQLSVIVSRGRSTDADRTRTLRANLAALKDRRIRLTDAFVDGTLDKSAYDERARGLVEDERMLREQLERGSTDEEPESRLLQEAFELASSPQQSYILGDSQLRRELALRLCSNRSVSGKHVSVEPYFPLLILANRGSLIGCDHQCTATRTFRKDPTGIRTAWRLYRWAKRMAKREASDIHSKANTHSPQGPE
jgi:site-specific DNA recombinase